MEEKRPGTFDTNEAIKEMMQCPYYPEILGNLSEIIESANERFGAWLPLCILPAPREELFKVLTEVETNPQTGPNLAELMRVAKGQVAYFPPNEAAFKSIGAYVISQFCREMIKTHELLPQAKESLQKGASLAEDAYMNVPPEFADCLKMEGSFLQGK